MTLQDVLARLEGAKRSGDGWIALCPAHDDHRPSLSINERLGTSFSIATLAARLSRSSPPSFADPVGT